TTLRFGGSVSAQEYENETTLENEQQRVELGVSRRVSPNADVGMDAFVSVREFDVSGQEDDDRTLRLWWNRRFASRFSFELAYQRDERDGAAGLGYDENSIRLLFEVDMRSRSGQ